MGKHHTEPSAENAAMFGAMLANKRLTLDQAAEVMNQILPVFDEAWRRTQNGEDVTFGISTEPSTGIESTVTESVTKRP